VELAFFGLHTRLDIQLLPLSLLGLDGNAHSAFKWNKLLVIDVEVHRVEACPVGAEGEVSKDVVIRGRDAATYPTRMNSLPSLYQPRIFCDGKV